MLEQLLQGGQLGREKLTQFLGSLSPQQKTLLFRGLPVLLIGVALGMYWLQRSHYRPLFSDLPPQDAAAIVRELEAQKIPYLLSKEGTEVEVPAELVYRTRVDLAGKGLPQGGGLGLELFDQKSPFGMSEFTQRVSYLRALQGELARTISGLHAVQSCRVHLALPSRSTFLGETEKPSASVVIDLRPGYQLTPIQVEGISNLVAASVTGLAPEKVAVVDSSGKPLRPEEARGEKNATELLYRHEREVERDLEARIESMLEPVLGPERVIARADVTLETRAIESTQVQYGPAVAERSKQVEIEQPANLSGGVPGVQANVVGGDAGKVADEVAVKRSSQVVNNEVDEKKSQVSEPAGQIRRLSVAVFIDGRYDGATYIARTAEEMEGFKAAVMKATGFSAERGDQIEVVNMPFKAHPEEQALAPAPFDLRQWIRTPQGMGVSGGLLSLFFLFWMLGRRRRASRIRVEQELLALGARGGVEGTPEGAQLLGEKTITMAAEQITVADDPRRQELMKIAGEHKELVVQIIRSWLKEEKQRLKGEMGARAAEG